MRPDESTASKPDQGASRRSYVPEGTCGEMLTEALCVRQADHKPPHTADARWGVLLDSYDRLRAENEALKMSWQIDADHRDQCYAALTAVWADMRGVDKHHVPADVIELVADAIGLDLDEHDPAYRSVETDDSRRPEEGDHV